MGWHQRWAWLRPGYEHEVLQRALLIFDHTCYIWHDQTCDKVLSGLLAPGEGILLPQVSLLCEMRRKCFASSLNVYLQSLLGPARSWQPLPHFKIDAQKSVGAGWLSGKWGSRQSSCGWVSQLPPKGYSLQSCHTFSPSFSHSPPPFIPNSDIHSGSHSYTVWLIQSLQRDLHFNSILRKTWLSQRKL